MQQGFTNMLAVAMACNLTARLAPDSRMPLGVLRTQRKPRLTLTNGSHPIAISTNHRPQHGSRLTQERQRRTQPNGAQQTRIRKRHTTPSGIPPIRKLGASTTTIAALVSTLTEEDCHVGWKSDYSSFSAASAPADANSRLVMIFTWTIARLWRLAAQIPTTTSSYCVPSVIYKSTPNTRLISCSQKVFCYE